MAFMPQMLRTEFSSLRNESTAITLYSSNCSQVGGICLICIIPFAICYYVWEETGWIGIMSRKSLQLIDRGPCRSPARKDMA